MRIVMKFGGSSLASAIHIRRAAELILRQRADGDQVTVVVSAQGDTTDELLERAREICPEPAGRERDMLLCCGEQMSMALMAMQLEALGCPAVSFCGWQAGIRTEARHGDARILNVEPRRVLQALEAGKVAVVAGFQGVDGEGELTTLGRGGSDTTAVALAAALQADVCRIYTDVQGVYSADPRVVEQAQVHREISYNEMLEMASLGAKVLHSRAVELAREHGVRVEVRSTFAPQTGGTALGGECGHGQPVRGIACDDRVDMVTVMGLGDGAETCRLFTCLADSGVSIDVIIRSPGDIPETGVVSFSVGASDRETVAAVLKSNRRQLGFSGFAVQTDMAKVSVVGAGMSDGCGVAAKMLRALQEGAIRPRYITTGELRISVILPKEQAGEAVRLIHAAFFES
ncbi:MAG: aspartate kinase [Clostridia bacterium]|nr:aspartate kinase [Clostridia bacterium]